MATVQKLADVSADQLIQRAIQMRPEISSQADETEKNRRVSQEFIEEVRAQDFFRIFLPKKYGGLEFDSATATRISLEWSSADASTGWVCGLGIVHQGLIAQFPVETHDDVWGNNPCPMTCGSYAPAGQMTAVDGGYRLTGEFHFSSGVDVSDWAVLGVFFPPENKDGPPIPGFTLVPRSDFDIDDNWHVMGLTGTGSKTIVCKDLFIPAHRRVTFAELVSGNSPGYQVLQNDLYRYPILSLVAYAISTPALGALNGAVDKFLDAINGRTTRGAVVLGGSKIRDFQAVQMRVGRAVANLKAAKAMLFAQIEDSRAAVMDRGEILDVTGRLDNRLTQAKTVELSVDGLDQLFGAVGGNGIHTSQHVQRAWRDAHAISHHISFNWDALTSMYGQHLLGLEPQGQY
ncbi:MAG: acyl-CoA dehydrogenase family protein [Pseudomonadota bacterium]|nr:acyl-CoA dehydrogenase family protein [Pseudomonadota bacterium]